MSDINGLYRKCYNRNGYPAYIKTDIEWNGIPGNFVLLRDALYWSIGFQLQKYVGSSIDGVSKTFYRTNVSLAKSDIDHPLCDGWITVGNGVEPAPTFQMGWYDSQGVFCPSDEKTSYPLTTSQIVAEKVNLYKQQQQYQQKSYEENHQSRFSRCTPSTDLYSKTVKVSRCGIPDVNGLYNKSYNRNGYPSYTKQNIERNGTPGNSVLHRGKSYWYIEFQDMKSGKFVGRKKALYKARVLPNQITTRILLPLAMDGLQTPLV